MFSNPIAAYKTVDRESEIRGSDPHRLIMLLFDGAIAALVDAEQNMGQKKIAEKSGAIAKAVAIISDGLAASLNLQAGGELAQNLFALYDYMVRRLVSANVQNDVGALREVRALLEELGGAWGEMRASLELTRTSDG
jgi:flagellar protein FliS